jgi:hypothetical protein
VQGLLKEAINNNASLSRRTSALAALNRTFKYLRSEKVLSTLINVLTESQLDL